ANIQYEVICEDHLLPTKEKLPKALQGAHVLLASSLGDFNAAEQKSLDAFSRVGGSIISAEKANWLSEVKKAVLNPSISVQGPPTIRATVYDQSKRTIIHLLNLNIQRLSSFEDKVTPAQGMYVSVRVP